MCFRPRPCAPFTCATSILDRSNLKKYSNGLVRRDTLKESKDVLFSRYFKYIFYFFSKYFFLIESFRILFLSFGIFILKHDEILSVYLHFFKYFSKYSIFYIENLSIFCFYPSYMRIIVPTMVWLITVSTSVSFKLKRTSRSVVGIRSTQRVTFYLKLSICLTRLHGNCRIHPIYHLVSPKFLKLFQRFHFLTWLKTYLLPAKYWNAC